MKTSEVLKKHALTYVCEVIKTNEPQPVIDSLKEQLAIVERKILANDEQINNGKVNFAKQFSNIKNVLEIDIILNYGNGIDNYKKQNNYLKIIKDILVDTIKIAETKEEKSPEQKLADSLREMLKDK